MSLFGSVFNNLESTLDILTARHTLIAGNIANIDTPGYKAKELDFKAALDSAIKKSGFGMTIKKEKHFRGSSLQSSPYAFVREQVNNSMRNDGNNVDIDSEMVALSQNSIMFDMATQLLSKNFEKLKYAISEGRRA